MSKGERQDGRDTVDRMTKRMRDSGVSSSEAKRRAVEAVRRLERIQKG